MPIRRTLLLCFATAVAMGGRPSPIAAQQPATCLLGSPDAAQIQRRTEMLTITRAIIAKEADAFQTRHEYVALDRLDLTNQVPSGVDVQLMASPEGYALLVIDWNDRCRSAFFANQHQNSVIFEGQLLR